MAPILTVNGLTKSFGANRILRGVDFAVSAGDVVAIIGASGSGKTTLLRCIDLLEEFEAGEIRLDGEALGYRTGGPAASACRAAVEAPAVDRHGLPELQPFRTSPPSATS